MDDSAVQRDVLRADEVSGMNAEIERVVIAGRQGLEAQAKAMRARFAALGYPDAVVETSVGLPVGEGIGAVVAVPSFRVDAAALDRLPDLLHVATPSVGLDHIDLDAAQARAVTVSNAAGYNTVEVAEHTLALVLLVLRDVPGGMRVVADGDWGVRMPHARRVTGSRLGIIGFGRIARAVAERAVALGMEVSIHARSALAADALRGIRQCATLDELLATSDVVCPLVALTPETRGILGAAEFARMPRGAALVNTGRGEFIDDVALVAALDRGHLSGAAVDVLVPEPPTRDHPLLTHPLIIVTPHMAWYSPRSAVSAYEIAAEAIVQRANERTT